MRTPVGCLYGGLAMKFTKPPLHIKQKEHHFKPGTSFNDILTLNLFDRKFRLLVMEAIERLEISFRTRFAYELSTQYGSHTYLDASLARRIDRHRQCIENLKNKIDRSQETFIVYYRTIYDEPVSLGREP